MARPVERPPLSLLVRRWWPSRSRKEGFARLLSERSSMRRTHHRYSAILMPRQDHILLKLDFSKELNLISRQHLLNVCAAQFLGLARWAAWGYHKTHPSSNSAALCFSRPGGVQQGDPRGPLWFAVALQPLALELREGPLATPHDSLAALSSSRTSPPSGPHIPPSQSARSCRATRSAAFLFEEPELYRPPPFHCPSRFSSLPTERRQPAPPRPNPD